MFLTDHSQPEYIVGCLRELFHAFFAGPPRATNLKHVIACRVAVDSTGRDIDACRKLRHLHEWSVSGHWFSPGKKKPPSGGFVRFAIHDVVKLTVSELLEVVGN